MNDSCHSLTHLFLDIRQSKAPSTAEISRFEALGLARANFCDHFQFNHNWEFTQLDSELHSLFPDLFSHLNSQPKVGQLDSNTCLLEMLMSITRSSIIVMTVVNRIFATNISHPTIFVSRLTVRWPLQVKSVSLMGKLYMRR